MVPQKTSVRGWADYLSFSGSFGVYVIRAREHCSNIVDAVEQQQQQQDQAIVTVDKTDDDQPVAPVKRFQH